MSKWELSGDPRFDHTDLKPAWVPQYRRDRALLEALAESVTDDSWRQDAACRGADPDWFFGPAGGHNNPNLHRALAVCRRCPVRADCLEAHIDETCGVWGGTTARERRRLRRIRTAAA